MKNSKTKVFIYQSLGKLFGRFSNSLDVVSYMFRSAKFFVDQKIPYFNNRNEYFNFIQKNIGSKEVVFLEFGVYSGESIRWWLRNNTSPNSAFYGFDTFTGLPEDWNNNPKGTFDMLGSIPDIDDKRVNFVKGLFSDTLPDFIEKNRETLSSKQLVIHLDADLYSSTFYVLQELRRYFKKGDFILFDEFFSFRNANTEFRSFFDYVAVFPLDYTAHAKTIEQFCVKIN